MAIGGALRAAMKAGNWIKVASESRRRARALADLNVRGGIRGPVMDTGEGLVARGFDFFEGGGRFARGSTSPNRPRFDVIRDPATGNRRVYPNPPGLRTNPIEAPYEGFRTFPQMGYNEPSSFMGRGRAPSFRNVPEPRYYDQGTDVFAEPFVFDPLGLNSFMNVPRAFGGNPGMGPAPRKRSPIFGGRPRIFFDDYSF
jgi:hypothetical protein